MRVPGRTEVHRRLCRKDMESLMGTCGPVTGTRASSWGPYQGVWVVKWMVTTTRFRKKGAVVCFLLLSLFLPSHSPLCCDLSSGIQVNKCHIFQPIFTPGNVPSPSPLSCRACFCYHCSHSHPHTLKYPLIYSQSVSQQTRSVAHLLRIRLLARNYGGQHRREALVSSLCPQAAYSLMVEHGQGCSKA